MLYDFLIVWLVGIVLSAYTFWQTRSSLFLFITGLLLVTMGYMLTYQGLEYQVFSTVNGETTRTLISVNDTSTLFLQYIGFAVGIPVILVAVYYYFLRDAFAGLRR